MADEVLNQISTHVTEAINLLSGQYRGKATFEGTVEMLVKQIQDLEDAAFDLVDIQKIANAEGPFLDEIGDRVGQARNGFSDATYRILIYVKIIENNSEGQPSAISAAYRLIMQAVSVQYINLGGANITLHANGTMPDVPGAFLYEQLHRVVAGGVKIQHLFLNDEVDADEMFALGGVDGPPAVGMGLGGADGTVGGYLTSILSD